MVDVVYLAGGRGKRAKLGYPKQFARLGGKPIMIHGLEVLKQIEEINNIILVHPITIAGKEMEAIIRPYFPLNFLSRVKTIPGGFTRQESVFNGLSYVKTPNVLIAEAVRPFITVDFVKKIINADADFVVPVSTSVSSVLVHDGKSVYPIARDHVGEVQLPQKFNTKVLKKAHMYADKNNYSDDSMMILQMAEELPVLIIDGVEQNIKITTPLDLVIAEAIYNHQWGNKE